MPPDEFYCWQALEKTGIYMIPGHVFDMKGSGNNFYYRYDLNLQGPSTSGRDFDDFKNLRVISFAPFCHKVFTGLSTIFRFIRLTTPLNLKRPLFPPNPEEFCLCTTGTPN